MYTNNITKELNLGPTILVFKNSTMLAAVNTKEQLNSDVG